MSISVDPRKIEKLSQLEATLELLQNPDSYMALLADVKITLRQLLEVSKRYSSIAEADKFLQEAKDLVVAAKQEANKILQEAKVVKSEADQKLKDMLSDIQLRAIQSANETKRLGDLQKLLSLQAETLKTKEQKIQEKMDELATIETKLLQGMSNLEQQKKDFNAKLEALRS